ncbi:MAG: methyltransferase domain-containing protein [Acidimicrobiia bacterium]
MSAGVDWEPGQYERFKGERARPFHDLVALIHPIDGGSAVDLGCGTGELTAHLHRQVRAGHTVGIDSSVTMLARSSEFAGNGLSFRPGDIADFDASDELDLVAANASLQWLPDHEQLLARLTRALRPGGQLAIQVPYNGDHPSHRLIDVIAGQEPFASRLKEPPLRDPTHSVLTPERYATLLHELGFDEQTVRMQVYGHVLESTGAIVEWTSGTTLTPVRARLDEAQYEEFVDRYRAALIDELGEQRPYFYAFKRVLFWARRQA